MYRVTLYNGSETTIIHEPSVNPRDPHLFTCTLTQGSSGEIDTLQFDILPNNPGYDQMFSRSTLVTVTDLNTTPEKNEFIGRVLTITPQMEESGMVYKTVVCEDRLGYLCDSIQPYIAEDTYTVEDFFTLLLENHNSQVEDYKKIYPGTISVTTSSGNVTKGLNYQTTWDALREKLLNSIGGEIQLYSGTDGLLYLDYVTELGTRDSQTIEIGKNMRSITQSIDPTTVITRLIPLGAKPEITEENPDVDPEDRLTIASVNDGKIYLDDEDAQAVYGIVEGVEYWDDVTLPENLLERGQEWLKNQTIIDSVSLSALDLSLIGLETDSIQRYNYYRTINPAIGLDSYLRVVKRTVDVVEPENITFEMGTQARSLASTLTDASNRASSAAGDAEAAINAELSKTVAVLIASNAQITELEAKVAYIESAYVDYEEVNTLIAEYLYAAIGEFGFLTADEADIRYASIGDLDALTANITALTAFAETVNVLLGGTGSFDELEAIHLTVENTVIDQAVIEQAVAGTILADLIYADYINTDVINIMSDDGGITIIGNQMQFTNGQIQFYDEDGNLRLQIGQDASGNFTFELYSADGSGVMIDENGVHESAITDGLIIDRMVADDANISGYKLNIEEICSIINTSNGVYTIEAAAVTIDGQQLSAWYTQINEELEGLYGLSSEGLIDYKPYFCLWDSDTDAPPADGELTAAICGTAICGLTICGVTDGILWKETDMPVTDGLYKWVKWKGYYLDGHEEWGDPYCLTDGYLREQTQVLQTGLTVLQGLIDAKVWETDIESYVDPLYGEVTTLTDNYTEIRVTVDGLTTEIASVTTTEYEHYLEMSSQITEITATVDGISSQVSSVTESIEQLGDSVDDIEAQLLAQDGVKRITPYFCLWSSGTETPPDNEDLTPAICGEAVCGLTICGVTDGSFWQETEPEAVDGLYRWIKWYLEFENEENNRWSNAYCLDDTYARKQISIVSDQYATLTIELDSIRQEVGDVQTIVAENYTYLSEQIATLEVTTSSISGTIVDLTETVQTVFDEVTGIQEQVIAIDSQVTSIIADTDGIRMDVENLQADITTIGTSLDEIESRIESLDGIESWIPYFCLWYSGSVVPPDNEGWTTADQTAGDGQYKWVKYLLTYVDGTTSWYGPYCLTDVYVRAQIDATWAQLDVLDDRITAQVAELHETIDGDYESLSLAISNVEQTAYQIQSTVESLEIELGESVSDLQTQITQTAADIRAEVTAVQDGLTQAVADFELGIQETQEGIVSFINASADVITLTGDRISISSDNFTLTEDGQITATGGSIAGFFFTDIGIYGGDASAGQACCMQVPRGDDEEAEQYWVFAAGGYSHTDHSDANFRVGSTGSCYTQFLRVGDDNADGERRVTIRSKYGAMAMIVGTGGSQGIYNYKLDEWYCRYYAKDDVNRFGNGNRGTEIYGNGISMMTSVTATGNITSGSSSSTSAQRVYAYNSYARVSLSVTDGGLGGIYDWRHGKWIIYTNTSGTVVTNSAIATLAEYDVDDISTLSSATFRDPNHEVVTHVNSHTYKVDGKKHLGLTVSELEEAMSAAGMNPDEYDLTEHWTDEDGNEVGAIRYEELIPMLISEIQSLNDRLDALEEE